MEKDIKILESYTTDLFHSYNGEVIIKATKNLLKAYKEMEQQIKDFYDGKTFTAKQLKEIEKTRKRYYIHNSKIKEIRDKAEVMDYYTLPDVIEDLNKLLEEE